MLICKKCGCDSFATTDTRNKSLNTDYLKRVRICKRCGYRFYTCEISLEDYGKYWQQIEEHRDIVKEMRKIIKKMEKKREKVKSR